MINEQLSINNEEEDPRKDQWAMISDQLPIINERNS